MVVIVVSVWSACGFNLSGLVTWLRVCGCGFVVSSLWQSAVVA